MFHPPAWAVSSEWKRPTTHQPKELSKPSQPNPSPRPEWSPCTNVHIYTATHPRARPDVGPELEDGHLEHEVDAGDELRGAGQRVDEGPRQVQVVIGPTVPA